MADLDLMLHLHLVEEAEFNRCAGTVGWALRDLPRMTVPLFDELIELLGKDNVQFMAGSRGDFRIKGREAEPCDPWVRATLLISPEGMGRVASHNAEAANG